MASEGRGKPDRDPAAKGERPAAGTGSTAPSSAGERRGDAEHEHADELLDEALDETFPASDPIQLEDEDDRA